MYQSRMEEQEFLLTCEKQLMALLERLMPIMDDFKAAENGLQYLSKIILQQAYHQVELDPESCFITIFSMHEGLFRYKILSYSASNIAELFKNI